jgi:class 3 adenylate cyclase/tetratricopeptide (TPR) repeat protein
MPRPGLLLHCAACATVLPLTAKFCIECGHPVAAAQTAVAPIDTHATPDTLSAALEGERKFVTVLFADLKGSMELVADRDPEEARKLLDPVLEHMCEAVEQYGGTVSQVMGDGIMALFGAPIAAEDHAVRAARAALTMQDLVRHYGDEIQRTHGVPIQIRVGLNSGEVVLRMSEHGLHMSYTAIGVTVHIAARMEQIAKPGSILATADTVRLAGDHVESRPIGPLKVKGFERPIEVVEIRRAALSRSRFDAAPTRAVTPFVGRQNELQRLLAAYEEAAKAGAGRLVLIVGDAGMGKSRMVYEFMRTLAGKNVLMLDGGAAPYGSGAGYRPGVHILRQYFNIVEADDANAIRQKVAGRIVALGGEADRVVVPILSLLGGLPADNGFHALPDRERRSQVVEALLWLNRRVAVDRPLVLAYEDLQWVTSDTRKFLERLVTEVPASTLMVLTYRSDYDASDLTVPEAIEVRLDGLAHDVTRELITKMLGQDASLDRLKEDLAERSGGNPLFVEEHVRSLIQSSDLQGEPGNYRLGAQLGAVEIPPTVRAVLAARIDRLSRDDKHVLQALAAVGDVATVDVLSHVIEMPTDDLRRSLRRLQIAGLLIERTDRAQLAYEFKHSLTQTVAYDSLLHARRRELHLRIMDALADTAQVEVLARHAVLGEAWEQALTYLWEAGKQAARQFADVEAAACYERALLIVKRLPPEKHSLARAIDLHLDMRNVLVPLARHRRLIEVLRAAEKLAEELGDERRLAQIASFISNYHGNVGRTDLALEAAERSLRLAEKIGEADILIMGALSAGEIHRTLGNYGRAKEFLLRVVGMLDPLDALSLHGHVGLPSVRVRSHLAWILAELGDFAEARAFAEEGLRIADAANHAYSLGHACLGLGGARVRQGEFEAAIPVLARGMTVTERVPILRPPLAADLGVAHARCGNLIEGLAHLHAAVDSATSMGRLSRLPLIQVKCGEIHLLAGEASAAARLAEDALKLAIEQNERGNVVYARYLLAEIHSLDRAARLDAAMQHYHDALTLGTKLGMKPLVARCNAGLGTLWMRIGNPRQADRPLIAARAMYRTMGMRYWQHKLDTDVAALAS